MEFIILAFVISIWANSVFDDKSGGNIGKKQSDSDSHSALFCIYNKIAFFWQGILFIVLGCICIYCRSLITDEMIYSDPLSMTAWMFDGFKGVMYILSISCFICALISFFIHYLYHLKQIDCKKE